MMLSQNLRQRRPGDIRGDQPRPISVWIGVNHLRGVKAADLAASLDLQTKTPPKLGIMGKYGVTNFDCDCPAAW